MELKPEVAHASLLKLVESRKKWGKLESAATIGPALLEAIEVLLKNTDPTQPQASDVTKLNRQLAAAGAREAGLKGKLNECREQKEELLVQYNKLKSQLEDLNVELLRAKATKSTRPAIEIVDAERPE